MQFTEGNMYIDRNYKPLWSQSSIAHTGRPRTSRRRPRHSVALVLLTVLVSASTWAQTGTPTTPETLASFGLIYNNTADVTMPISHNAGVTRIWDDGMSWPAFAPTVTSGNPNWSTQAFSALDTFLANDWNSSALNIADGDLAWFELGAHTPYWALSTSSQTCSTNVNSPTYIPSCDVNCNYYNASKWALGTGTGTSTASPGQCYPPNLDLGIDGSGTDATWKAWVTKIANHANGLDNNPNYTYPACSQNSVTCHAHIHYWTIWNEFDDTGNDKWNTTGGYISTNRTVNGVFFIGSYAQLVRMTEEADCIIRGSFNSNGTGYINLIHNDPTVGQTTTCTGAGIDKNAVIVMPSSHAYVSFGTNVAQNFLYCSGQSETGSGLVTTGVPEYCNTGSDGAAAIGAINFHMKPGSAQDNNNGFNVEQEMTSEYCSVVGMGVSECSSFTGDPGILETAELDKPFYNGEAGYSGNSSSGWAGSPGGTSLDISGNPDYQASFVIRYLLTQWSLGIQNSEWYQVDNAGANYLETNGTLTEAGNAYNNLANALAVSAANAPLTMTAPCSNTSGTVWACGFTNPSVRGSQEYAFIWDTKYSTYTCPTTADNGSGCLTHELLAGTNYTMYENLITGVSTTIPTSGANKGKVPVGVIPIMLY